MKKKLILTAVSVLTAGCSLISMSDDSAHFKQCQMAITSMNITDGLTDAYLALSKEKQQELKQQLEDQYHLTIASDRSKAFQYRDIHNHLVQQASGNKECRSYMLTAQQPHATKDIWQMHNGIPSQLAGNQIMTKLGSDIIKISPEKRWLKYQGLETKGYESLDELILHPLYKKVLDLPYRYAFLWAHGGKGKSHAKFQDGLTEVEKANLYKEFFNTSCFLLKHYNNSGKIFMFGNWEGDWLLSSFKYPLDKDFTDIQIQGMIDWFNIRGKAIEDAKAAVPHSNVNIHLYCEINHLAIARDNKVKRIVDAVLPFTRVDYVSVSSYDIQKYDLWKEKPSAEDLRELVFHQFDYVETMLPPRDIPGKRVFTGEIGFHRDEIRSNGSKTEEEVEKEQARMALINAQVNLEWGMPFWLWWAVHNNEKMDNGEFRGFGIIDQVTGHKSKLYYEFEKYYTWANDFDPECSKPAAEFRAAAIEQLKRQIAELY